MNRKSIKLIDRLFVTVDKYPQFLQVVSILVGLVHVTVFCMLWISNIKPLACFNIISIAVYIACFILSKKRKNLYLVYLFFVTEVAIFSFIMTLLIKEDCMFSAYTYALICFCALTKFMVDTDETQKGKKFPALHHMGLLVVLFFVEFWMGKQDFGIYSLERESFVEILLIFNNACGIACVVIGILALLNISLDKDEKINRALDEAEDLRKQAELSNSAKSAFLASMSHEIRTPINAVLGMDNMILMESEDEKILSYASDIKNAGNTLLSLINDILDTSKIEAGGMTIEPMEYMISSLINDCYSMALFQAAEKDLVLGVKVNPFLPSCLYGDEDRIRQIITNILSNAIKYTREGGVEFSVDYNEIDNENVMLVVIVKDTGIGIAPENIDKIFGSFKRVDTQKNRNILGTGLGLSITKQLINLMDGKVFVESTVGEGSTFTIKIPQKVVKRIAIGNFEPRANLNMNNQMRLYSPESKILVVDDMDVNLRVFSGLLKATQIQVDTAQSGEKCLEMAKAKKYDMIFLDHMMPDMDGFETYDALRENPEDLNISTPVVMLTANAIAGAKEEYISRGFSDYLSKPIQLPELIDMLVKYLPEDKVSFKEAEKKTVVATEDAQDNSFAKRFAFLDTKSGLLYNGSDEELYLMTITDYYNEDLTEKLTDRFNAEDYSKYAVFTHSLKSASLGIGAIEMHEKAKEHELAAKAGDTDFVKADFEELIRVYSKLRSQIKEALGV